MHILSHNIYRHTAKGFQGVMESKNEGLNQQADDRQSEEVQADLTAELESEAEEAAHLSNFDSI